MIKQYRSSVILLILFISTFGITGVQMANAQVFGPNQIKWLWVGSLRSYFSNACAEIEYGRRGRGGAFLSTDQCDGFQYPAQYQYQDHNIGESMWIGTTNFDDPVSGRTYANKVVCAGRLVEYLNQEIYPEQFSLVARVEHPNVFVDDGHASDLDLNDAADEVNPNLPADRMIYNKVNTTIGITVTRKVLAFTQQYNDNYYIYEYTFKNTGIIDNSGQQRLNKTLTDVIFHFQYRLGFYNEPYRRGWGSNSGASWGRNTVNDVVGQDAAHTLPAPNDFRAVYAFYGPHSAGLGIAEDAGAPNTQNGSVLGGTGFAGAVVLHADRSTADHSDDPTQPTTTRFMGSDGDAQGVTVTSQYDPVLMTQKYQFMTAGHPATHLEQVGKDPVTGWPNATVDTWGSDRGGYSSAQGFGPYTMAIGDSIKIVIAQAAASINREKNLEVAHKWFANTPPFILPDGSTTTDRNLYKNEWFYSGKDSLFQTFRRAIANYKSGYAIPQPPAAPESFNVASGGNRIILTWTGIAAEANPHFNGYEIWRAESKTDTTFEKIFSCTKADLTHSFDDKTARRGFNYFYYIVSKDDGTTNDVAPGVPLVSNKFLTMTNHEAFLRRPSASALSEIRIVPNPFNIRATALQYGSATPDRLAFYGLPPYCVIKIYTERGDLIQTINHINGSGDELWHSLTSSGQLVVSGLYIAYFEVTQDGFDENGTQLFRKGENTFRKFIIIR